MASEVSTRAGPAAVADSAWTQWPAPAKLNLFLRIVGRRADGYHLLQTVFQLLDWGDHIALRPRRDGRIVRHRGAAGVAPADDLVVRAARTLKKATGCDLGADIDVDKQIPQGGGFGGGSSNAATVLVGLNQVWQLGLNHEALADIGVSLGADVPVFVHGRSAFAQGIGDQLTPLDLPQRWFLLLDPGFGMPTAELFGAKDLTRDAAPATISDFLSGSVHGNAFEPVLRKRSERFAAMLDRLAAFGVPHVTGTGAGVFLAFDDPARADTVRAKLPPPWRAWIAKGVNESALQRSQSMHMID